MSMGQIFRWLHCEVIIVRGLNGGGCDAITRSYRHIVELGKYGLGGAVESCRLEDTCPDYVLYGPV